MRAAPRRLLIGIAVLAALLLAALAWIAFSPSAVRIGLERAAAATGGRLAIEGVEGRLVDGLRLRRLDWADDGIRVGVDRPELRWDWRGLLDGRLAIGLVRADTIEVELDPAGERAAGPAPMPGSIGLPITVLVGRMQADLIRLRRGGGVEPMEFTGLEARAAHLPGEYRVEALRVDTPWGELAADSLRVGTEALHPIVGDASLITSAARLGLAGLKPDLPPIAIAATIAGDLERLRIEARAQAGEAELRARLGVAPLEPALADGPSRLELSGIDPSAWLPDAPAANLSGHAQVDGAMPLRGRIELDNAAVGSLPEGRVPLVSLRTDFVLEEAALRLAPLEIGLAGDGRIEGWLAIDRSRTMRVAGRELPAATTRLTLAGIDPAQWAAALRATRIDGEAALSEGELTALLAERRGGKGSLTGREPLAVDLRAQLGEEEIRIAQARVGHGGSGLDASGTIRLEPLAIDLAGQARGIDPSQWLDLDDSDLARLAAGRIEGRWQAKGAPGQGDLAVTLQLGDSRLAGAVLGGRLEVLLDAGMRVSKLDADLRLGGNRLQARGAIGRPEDRLSWTLDAAEPALFDARVAGRVSGSGELGLAGGRPWGSGRLEGRALGFDGRVEVRRADVRLAWPREADAAFDARIALQGVVAEGIAVDAAGLDIDGTPAAHRFALGLRAAGQRLSLAGRGAWDADAPRWDGVLESGRLDGTESVVLEAGAQLGVSPAGVGVAGWRLVAPDGRGGSATIEHLDLAFGEAARVASSGTIAGLPLARLLAWLDRVRGRPGGQADIEKALASLRVDGQWRIDGGTTLDTFAGEMQLGLREADDAGGQRLDIGTGSGARLRIDARRLAGRVDLELPSLVLLRRYLGEDWGVEGRMRIAADIGGTVDEPRLDGSLTGDGLVIEQRSQGWRLDDGELRASFDGSGLVIERFRIASGEGDVVLSGRAALIPDAERDPGEPGRSPGVPLRGEFDLEARRFRAPLDPGQRLVLSGHARLTSDGRAMNLTGQVAADEGLIELRSAGVPALPDDIRIVGVSRAGGEEDGGRPPVDTGGMRVGADIEIDLGRDIRIVGGGIDTRLAGLVRLRGALPATPRIEGTVRVRDGTFEAYGQHLDITRGSIRFNGPVDNPALDITATRPHLPIVVGVRLTGTALSPRIALFSNPEIPDSEKLSWLVLGVPLADASSGAQALALQQAAATLFGGDGGAMSGSIGQRFGVDVLALGLSSSTGQGEVIANRLGSTGLPGAGDSQDAAALREVVTVGKRLASGVYISYEQGLQGAWNLLRIQYDISRRLTLRLQTGSESAIDLLMQRWFD